MMIIANSSHKNKSEFFLNCIHQFIYRIEVTAKNIKILNALRIYCGAGSNLPAIFSAIGETKNAVGKAIGQANKKASRHAA